MHAVVVYFAFLGESPIGAPIESNVLDLAMSPVSLQTFTDLPQLAGTQTTSMKTN